MNLAHLILLITFMLPKINSNELNEQVVFPQDPIDQQTQTETPDENVELFKVCEDGLGCIETDQTWYHKEYRPVNLKPLPRHIVKTDFVLIKKPNQQDEQLLYASFQPKQDSIKRAGFCNESELMIMIHDFTANGYTGWIKHLSLSILENAIDYNLVSVDWQRGAEAPFDQAIANARLVALEINILLKELKEKMNYSLDNVHVIGHGVGAHIAGYVGAIHSKIKKITGLDPSGPRFQGMPYNVKLNPRSAKYVQVIHTDFYHTKSQGINESLGHSDFYVNGNEEQPGCSENSTVGELTSLERGSLNEGEILPGCSHKRAFKYFIESISSKNCTFQGIRCNSLDDFQNGKCASCDVQGHDCRIFGLKNYLETSENNMFFLNTANHPPFCMLEYRITIHIKDDEKHGYFNFILIDESADISKAYPARNEKNTKPLIGESNAAITGNTFLYFATQPKLGKLKEIKAKWNDKGTVYKLFCKKSIKVQKITVLFLGTGEDDGSEETHFCPPTTYVEIENGSYVTFKKCSEKSATTTESSEKIVATRSAHYRKEYNFSSTGANEVTKRIIHSHELRTVKLKADVKRFETGSTNKPNKPNTASTSIRQIKYKKISMSGKTTPSTSTVHVRTTNKSKNRKNFYSKNLKKKEDNWETFINNEDKTTNETSEDADYQQLLSSLSTSDERTTTTLPHTKQLYEDSKRGQHNIQNKQQVNSIQDEENLIKASPLKSKYTTKPAKKLFTSKILHPNIIKSLNQQNKEIVNEMYDSTTEAPFINSEKSVSNHKNKVANSSKWTKSKTTIEYEPVEDSTQTVNALKENLNEIDENNETESKIHHIKDTNNLNEGKNIAPVEDSAIEIHTEGTNRFSKNKNIAPIEDSTIELQIEDTNNNISKEKSIVPVEDSTEELHSEETDNDISKERNIESVDDYYTKRQEIATEKTSTSKQSVKSHYNARLKNEELKAFKDSLNTIPNEDSTNENLDELLETVYDDDDSKSTETDTTIFNIDKTSDTTRIKSHTGKSDQLSAKWKVYLDKMSKDIEDSNKIPSTSKICVSSEHHHYTTNEYLSTAKLYALLPRIQTESELITQDDIDGKWKVNSEKMEKVFNETYVDKNRQNLFTTQTQVPTKSPSTFGRNRYELEYDNITSESLFQNTNVYSSKTSESKAKFTTRNVQDNNDFTVSPQNISTTLTEDENLEGEMGTSLNEDEDLESTTKSSYLNIYPTKINEDVASITKGFLEEDKNKHQIIHEYITKNNVKESDVPTSGSSFQPFNPIEHQIDYIIDSVTKDIDRDSTLPENES
ncbi:unnamed protein product [Phyllotreta striolata]|uniref:Lipase domain-containing protein n=1 Tax=Phyllotreta striolata TaxID=444603 RepID=A0A9N9TQG8_PHYSR|nr:unnamed protein product [Phyllotreta striolata]